VTEIGIEQTGLFDVTGSTMPIFVKFVIEIVIEFFRTSSARSEKFFD